MTAFKNRVHKVLEKANIRISGVLSEFFGIAGLQILNGILNRKDIDGVLKDVKTLGKAAIKEAYEVFLQASSKGCHYHKRYLCKYC
jgi:transposase